MMFSFPCYAPLNLFDSLWIALHLLGSVLLDLPLFLYGIKAPSAHLFKVPGPIHQCCIKIRQFLKLRIYPRLTHWYTCTNHQLPQIIIQLI
ncbi:hypothetical protein COLO4_33330 [Corchorus olitorius]|uniref:Uncharacterized protein n=1 Tax=Corchorus olitorius TaxID=93759 RepID=A0A1R3GUU7_9ROSI|nr:hypothetical protein COLO4_33330 [Corchorus olitorius]